MNLTDIQAIHDNSVAKGFYDDWEARPQDILAKMCLIHSEVSEVMEAYRKNQGSDKIMDEFADIFIRCYDLIVALHKSGIIDSKDINKSIKKKMEVNSKRGRLHGNAI